MLKAEIRVSGDWDWGIGGSENSGETKRYFILNIPNPPISRSPNPDSLITQSPHSTLRQAGNVATNTYYTGRPQW